MSKKRLLGPCAIVFDSTPTGSWRISRPIIDNAVCIRCEICVKHCPTNVMTLLGGDKAAEISIDYDYCKGCGICVDVCPKRCIDFVPEREATACPKE